MRVITLESDILILGGGASGCYAALHAASLSPCRTILVEKAHIRRSGCLAAGINAINAYIGEGRSPHDYVDYATDDAEGIARKDLLLSMSRRLNPVVGKLEKLGLVIQKEPSGKYACRGWRNVKINGENIKPLLASAVMAEPSITVLNHVNLVSLLTRSGRVFGALGFSTREQVQYVLLSPAVICATGGASGLYRPNNPGQARRAMWYSPFNAGSGYAMGIRAGAEMTSLEMRFVALRCKDTIAPTGTLAQGAGALQVNRHDEVYEQKYGLRTHQRVYGTHQETAAGRGPCRLLAKDAGPEAVADIYKAYLNMAPAQTLLWVQEDREAPGPAKGGIRALQAEIEGTEPYVVGGHTGSGYWVDSNRKTTLEGLYAVGDCAGGCPQKYVSGSMAEAEIAVEAILAGPRASEPADTGWIAEEARSAREEALALLRATNSPFTVESLEEAMQKIMDEQAGGRIAGYAYSESGLARADQGIERLGRLAASLSATDMRELMRIHELRDRLTVCRSLIAHLAAREETRWPGFGIHLDFQEKKDNWLRFVNSRMESGRIEIVFRDLPGQRTEP